METLHPDEYMRIAEHLGVGPANLIRQPLTPHRPFPDAPLDIRRDPPIPSTEPSSCETGVMGHPRFLTGFHSILAFDLPSPNPAV